MTDIAVAFPRDPTLRTQFRTFVGLPMPAIVPDSQDMKCETCDMILAVGPRIRAFVLFKQARLACPKCAVLLYGVTEGNVTQHLGNPDSKFEE